MLKSDVQHLLKLENRLFSKRSNLLNYWQTVAENFYPERADFTTRHALGKEFADHLTTSYPIIARRELAAALQTMLQPRDGEWFFMDTARPDIADDAGRKWLEWATGTQRRAVYSRAARFTRAIPQGNNDFATFGQAVITVEMHPSGLDFLFRCKHLRDVVWQENAADEVDTIFERWKPTARDLAALFPKSVHAEVSKAAKDEPFKDIDCCRIIVPAELYQGEKKWRQPFVSLYVDKDNEHLMEERGVPVNPYVIPRWQTVSGSQYAYSPATVAALPDARLIQAISLTLLDAAEMNAAPPMIAVQEAIRSDVNLQPRGVTWVEADYDERLGEVLRPLTRDKSGIPFGVEVQASARDMIAEALYLNKLSLLPAGITRDMTAFEVGQRVQEHIRSNLPLFEPMEAEFNGGLCETTFHLGMVNGLFGPPDSIPQSIQGQEIEFRFVSPLTQALERKDATRFLEARDMLAAAAALDEGLIGAVDASAALRDALKGVGAPAHWIRSEAEMSALQAARQQQAQAQQAMAAIGQAAQVAEQGGRAAEALSGAGAQSGAGSQ